MVSASLIIFMILTIALLFTAMVFSAMASADAQKDGTICKEGCHKYSMWSALVTGIAVAVIIVIMVVYIYVSRKEIAAAGQEWLRGIDRYLGKISGVERIK